MALYDLYSEYHDPQLTPAEQQLLDGALPSSSAHIAIAMARAVGTVLARTRNAGLELPRRRYASVVWGKPQSIIFVDSVMLIALNHYLGAEYEGYSHFPLYSRLVKEPAIMPFDISEALIATAYPFAGHRHRQPGSRSRISPRADGISDRQRGPVVVQSGGARPAVRQIGQHHRPPDSTGSNNKTARPAMPGACGKIYRLQNRGGLPTQPSRSDTAIPAQP